MEACSLALYLKICVQNSFILRGKHQFLFAIGPKKVYVKKNSNHALLKEKEKKKIEIFIIVIIKK